ncbi:hypothetical protein EJB05_52201 [Eragrostis curvula]|uniref:Uncharacterized protein n=1 Tax=Eragrostis curvula TaxID=38414 RepID=A0A5J9STH4_9POAL|nr:hypothetical protein EJB05_52201 [Eragrostis curvula]
MLGEVGLHVARVPQQRARLCSILVGHRIWRERIRGLPCFRSADAAVREGEERSGPPPQRRGREAGGRAAATTPSGRPSQQSPSSRWRSSRSNHPAPPSSRICHVLPKEEMGRVAVEVGFPVVSMDEPHIICFMVCDEKAWLIMVDMRSNMLRSVYCYSKRENGYPGKFLLPSKVSYYLNSYSVTPSCCHLVATRLLSRGAHTSEILAALEEISSYGLDGDDMRKAISNLSRGNGRRFRSYLGIPKILRKDWLLTEINASIS